MAGKADPKEIPGFALLEIRAAPDRDQRRDFRVVAIGLRLENQGAAAAGAVGVIDHFHVVAVAQVVDSCSAGQIIKTQVVVNSTGDFQQLAGIDDHALITLAVIKLHGIWIMRPQIGNCAVNGCGIDCLVWGQRLYHLALSLF